MKISLARILLGATLTAATGGLWLAATAAASPQRANETQAPEAAAAFGETVDVQLVNVEVWVTDRQGNPVTGLGAGDFEVREDRKVVEISNFAEIRDDPAGDPFAPTAPIEAPVAGQVRERSLKLEDLEEPRAAQGTGFLALYFDELFSKPEGRKQLIKDLRTFPRRRSTWFNSTSTRAVPASARPSSIDRHLRLKSSAGRVSQRPVGAR